MKLLLIVTVFAIASATFAQIQFPLRLDKTAKSETGIVLFCDKNYNCGLFENELAKNGTIGSEEPLAKVQRFGSDFYLWIDTNGNRSLADEKKLLVKNGEEIVVNIRKRAKTKAPVYLPFGIRHSTDDIKGQTVDSFFFHPRYVAAGTLKYGGCSAKIALSDMDRDGSFTNADSARGSNLKIDRNNDGKFWGREEFIRSEQILEFCGANFLITRINNSSIALKPTALRVVKIGEKAPAFTLSLANGKQLNSNSLTGKHYVLDFWASWCVPCVENLPHFSELRNRYAGRVEMVSINVDSPSRRALATKIIAKNNLSDFCSIRGLGNADPLWKVFGGANFNRLTIPLYVLVDEKGIVRYADGGGEGLSDLVRNIDSSFSN